MDSAFAVVLAYLKGSLLELNIIELVLTVGSLLFLARQTLLLRKTYQYNCDWQEKEKAIVLAKYYKDEILPGVNYISSVFKETGIMSCLGGIHPDNIVSFNQSELFRLTNRDIKEQIQSRWRDPQNLRVLLNERDLYQQISKKPLRTLNPNLIAMCYAEFRGEKDEDGNAVVVPDEIKSKLLSDLWVEFYIIVSATLNSLELFSMNFITGVADGDVVFQSLHQTFLVLVQILYYDIAIQNTNEKDTYYTNVIELYKLWLDKDKKNEQTIHAAMPKAGGRVRK